MKKNRVPTTSRRNIGVTILSSVIAILAFMLALSIYDGSLILLASSIFLGFMGLVFSAIAIYGRPEPLKQFIETIFVIPF